MVTPPRLTTALARQVTVPLEDGAAGEAASTVGGAGAVDGGVAPGAASVARDRPLYYSDPLRQQQEDEYAAAEAEDLLRAAAATEASPDYQRQVDVAEVRRARLARLQASEGENQPRDGG